MNEMVAFINLFFVPILPGYIYCKRTGKSVKLTPENFIGYCIVAVLLIPITKIVLIVPEKVLRAQINIYSGYYTMAAFLAAFIVCFTTIFWEKKSLLLKWVSESSRKVKNSFLLKRQTESFWSGKKKLAYYAYRMNAVIFSAFLMGILLLNLAAGDTEGLFSEYFRSWKVIVLNTAPIMLLTILLYGVTGRAWIGLLLGGGISAILGLINYYKLSFRNDPLHMEELLLFREATNMSSSGYTLYVDGRIAVTIGSLIALAVFLYFAAPGKFSNWKKRGMIVVIAGALSAIMMPVYRSKTVYESIRDDYGNPIENYAYRGFVYPFLYSVNDMIEILPSGYDEGKAKELLSGYEDKNIPEGRKINIIAVMREAYTDFSRYGIPGLDTSVYDTYHTLEKESYVGDMVSNVFAGDTIITERNFLTGNYQKLRSYRSDFNSYVWYMRQQGYTTEGSHPYFAWFYSRNTMNGLMGFENYRFYENDYENLCQDFYCPDSILLSEIYSDYQKNKSTGKPYFSFSVTMQTHGPYPTDRPAPEKYLIGPYSEECQNAISWYLHYLAEIDQELVALVEQLRFDPEPVVLITFGDHMPWMGAKMTFYNEMGLDIQCGQEGSMYSTRYLIWANEAAKELLGHDVRGEGPTVSPCYLMNLLFQQIDWEGPAFLQAMDDMMKVFPVIHVVYREDLEHYVVDEIFVEEIPEERKELFNDFCYLQGYWRSKYLFADGVGRESK